MKYTVFDKEMRMFEKSLDQKIAPDVFLVARLDGRGFTRLTKELLVLDKPFDVQFRDAMVETVKSTMQCGFSMLYGYTQSDEISLLFAPDENTFGRKVRKLTSILAGQASAQLSLQLGIPAVFDCRLVPLPDEQRVMDYFRWRAEDANRNALNAWCYWTLRDEGASVQQATGALNGMPTQAKHELLQLRKIAYNDLPVWQKRGTGLYYQAEVRNGLNPVTGQRAVCERMQLRCDTDLPAGAAYEFFIKTILTQGVLYTFN